MAIGTDKLDALYRKLKPKGVTMTALLAKACGVALEQHPLLYAGALNHRRVGVGEGSTLHWVTVPGAAEKVWWSTRAVGSVCWPSAALIVCLVCSVVPAAILCCSLHPRRLWRDLCRAHQHCHGGE